MKSADPRGAGPGGGFAAVENAVNSRPTQPGRQGALAMLKLAAIFAAVFLAEFGDKTGIR